MRVLKIEISEKEKGVKVEVGQRTLKVVRALEKWGNLGVGQGERGSFQEGLSEMKGSESD